MKKMLKNPGELFRKIWITSGAFLENDLFTYAAAGACNFILSALPILLMTLAVLLRVFHASPEALLQLVDSVLPQFHVFDYEATVSSILYARTTSLVEIILGLTIFWMARRFFASLQRGLAQIWRKRGKGRPIRENLLIIAGEVLLVVLIVSTAISVTTANAFFRSALSRELINPAAANFLSRLFLYTPLGAIFLFLFLVYDLLPRVRPAHQDAALAAAACTASFWITQTLYSLFIDMTRYNLVYGILSNAIVLVLEVYTFFLLFLYWAQFLYAKQFYESFLVSRICLLPPADETNLFRRIERRIFRRPELFFRKYACEYRAGDAVYSKNDESQGLFYIWKGSILTETKNEISRLGEGSVFGEIESLSGALRISTVRAETDSTVLKIPEDIFLETLEVDGELSRWALFSMTDFLRKKQGKTISMHP